MSRVRLVSIVAYMVALSACTGRSGSDSSSATSSTPASTAVISIDPAAASKEAEARKALEDEITQRINVIIAAADTASSLDEKLDVLVTSYCKLSGPAKERDSDAQYGSDWGVVQGLRKPYAAYWRAESSWKFPLNEAGKQACPLPSPTTAAPPYPKR